MIPIYRWPLRPSRVQQVLKNTCNLRGAGAPLQVSFQLFQCDEDEVFDGIVSVMTAPADTARFHVSPMRPIRRTNTTLKAKGRKGPRI